jgi:hypothetical protein
MLVMVSFLTSLSYFLDECRICYRHRLEQCVELLDLACNLLVVFGQQWR